MSWREHRAQRDAVREDFEAFVRARRPALVRTAYLLTGNRHDAEDLVQTALVKAVGAWPRITGHPEPYVRRILVHENISRLRRRSTHEVPVDRLPEIVGADLVSGDEVGLRAALAALAPRQRAVIVLRYYEDLTERQTAAALGIAIGTVKSQTRDGLDRLRTLLPDLDLPDPDLPERDLPERDLPELDLPERDLPERDLPDRDLPDRDLPDRDLPERDLPHPDPVAPEGTGVAVRGGFTAR